MAGVILYLARWHTRATRGSKPGFIPLGPITGLFSFRYLAMGLLFPSIKSMSSTTISNFVRRKST